MLDVSLAHFESSQSERHLHITSEFPQPLPWSIEDVVQRWERGCEPLLPVFSPDQVVLAPLRNGTITKPGHRFRRHQPPFGTS